VIKDVTARHQFNENLEKAHQALERQVEECKTDIETAEQLCREIALRKQAEKP
jgi:hypothetical protein